MFQKKLQPEDVKIELLSPTHLYAALRLPNGEMYERTWTLFAPVITDQMAYDVTPYKVAISLVKQNEGEEWEALEAGEVALPEEVKRRKNEIANKRVTPYAQKAGKPRDWDELEQKVKKDEEEEKPAGQDALHKLFQQIYANGDEATKRAMMKSYQTSGGTVLSTNWKEVAAKDYEKEITPPQGQEVRKWNE